MVWAEPPTVEVAMARPPLPPTLGAIATGSLGQLAILSGISTGASC